MKTFVICLLLAVSVSSFDSRPIKTQRTVSVEKAPVKVYATPNNAGSITMRSAHSASLSFYLFDVEGTLIYQCRLLPSKEQLVTGLVNGTYTYTIFNNDTNINEGKIILK